MNIRLIVAMLGVQDAHHPELAHLKSPVTVEHTLWKCERCQQDAWIGPKQKLMVTLNGHEAVCYRCIFKDPDFEGGLSASMIGVNPEIENVARRWQ